MEKLTKENAELRKKNKKLESSSSEEAAAEEDEETSEEVALDIDDYKLIEQSLLAKEAKETNQTLIDAMGQSRQTYGSEIRKP